MIVQELTEEQAELICSYYHKQYNLDPCSNCPFSVSEACAEYVMFRELNDEEVAVAKGGLNAN